MSGLLSDDCVLDSFRATSKKQALQSFAAKLAEKTGLSKAEVFADVMKREQLGTTGVGKGVAIPHARMPGLTSSQGLFAKLDAPIGFDSIDGEPVDIIFMLIAPDDGGTSHLQTLARVARFLRNPNNLRKIRAGDDALKDVLSPFLDARDQAA